MKKFAIVSALALAVIVAGCSAPAPDAAPATTRISSTVSPSPSATASPRSQPSADVPGNLVADAPASFNETVSSIIDEADDYRVGMAVADTAGDAVRVFGDDSAFFAASTAKIITAAAFYSLVEDGEASLDERLGQYDAAFQIEAMVNNSNNDAWLLLMLRIGYSQLVEYAETLGVVYDPRDNLLSVSEMAQVMKLLHSGELLSRENRAELLGYMQETNNEKLIPAGSHPEVSVHHKYGQISGNLHDAALLSYRQSTIVLVIYTERGGGGSKVEQTQLIRSLTHATEKALFAPVFE